MKRFWIFAMIPLLFAISCGSKGSSENSIEADTKMEKAYKAKDYQQMLTLADELESSGIMTTAKADYWRGYANDRMKRKRMAEFYWKSSLNGAANSTNSEDMDIYAKSASRLANMLTVRGDYENALKNAIPVAERLEELKCDTTSDYINLLIYIGCCQAGIGKAGDTTTDGFDRAYQKHLDNIEKHHSDAAYKDAIAGLINIAYACITIEDYKDALTWTDNFGKLLGEYEQRPGTSDDYIDKQLARYNIYKTIALEGLGKKEEAAKVYDAFMTTQFSKTPEGRINANDYLTLAGRWGEAADNYKSLDALLGNQEAGYSIDNIQNLMLKKYRANLLAGRRDSAIAVSLQICDSLDNAFSQAKRIDEEEQATIVQKVEQMTEQQAEATRMNHLTQLVALLALLLCFVVYMLYRRYRNHQLKKAHKELRNAYGQLEEKTIVKERIETENRIAHDLQEGIIPAVLPRYDHLKFHAQLYPGNGISTDFYDYIIREQKLMFCIGYAINNDIQSSILSHTTCALFHTAATFEDAPDRIMTAINEAVTKKQEDASQGVALFVGALELTTGRLLYCNAGMDNPLLLGTEVSLLPLEPNDHIGVESQGQYISQETTLDSGTMLFLYTRGLVTVKNADGKPMGEKRMRGTALQAMKQTPNPKAFVENMYEAVEKYSIDTPHDNDISMLVIQR